LRYKRRRLTLVGLSRGGIAAVLISKEFNLPKSSQQPNKSGVKSLTAGVHGVLGGSISFAQAVREGFRRGRALSNRRRERAMLDQLGSQPARLRPEFQSLCSSDLLNHFRKRVTPSFFPGFEFADSTCDWQRRLFPEETQRLIESAQLITKEHRWPLLGLGVKGPGRPINWQRDPLSSRSWPLDYHADMSLWHNDGSDVRVLWELNRLGHLITLGRAYALTKNEEFAAEFFKQVESWRAQNPLARGANWACAMEVALRAINLFTALSLFRGSSSLCEEKLSMMLATFDQHAAHIQRNLEFSHLSTSNHYLSDLAGLLWIAIMLPELIVAEELREWTLAEMLREMEKQILPDGADYESSTGYHRFVLELFLYSFILCRANGIPIAEKYWRKLHAMLVYLRAIVRPDGPAPLIGDTDGGQVLPIVSRNANDHGYLLSLGAVVFSDSQLKLPRYEAAEELLWLLGEEGLRKYDEMNSSGETSSQAFAAAGTYVLRHEDLFLLFNANGFQKGRPASHRHNDALSVEISAYGCAFIVDPGSYLYTADLHERHLFRSTSYHSTVQIDDVEQNTIREESPFVIGAEARVRVLSWETTPERARIVAEHSGYERLPEPVEHRRAVTFYKQARWWLIEDEINGKGEHKFAARFHFDAGLEISPFESNGVMTCDKTSGARLLVYSLDLDQPAELEARFTSRHYGSRHESLSACWTTILSTPFKLRWAIVPMVGDEDPEERLNLIQSPMSDVQRPLTGCTSDIGHWTLD
jgi:hypothetical protein